MDWIGIATLIFSFLTLVATIITVGYVVADHKKAKIDIKFFLQNFVRSKSPYLPYNHSFNFKYVNYSSVLIKIFEIKFTAHTSFGNIATNKLAFGYGKYSYECKPEAEEILPVTLEFNNLPQVFDATVEMKTSIGTYSCLISNNTQSNDVNINCAELKKINRKDLRS